MRSAQLTTSPSGVAGAGRDHEWLRMPSRVSSHRLSGASDDVGAPHGVVVAAGHVGAEGVLARVAAGAVAAVVAEGDGLGQGHVEPAGPGDGRGHLGHLEGVGEPGPLVVVGEHEHLGLAGQAPEGGGVQDAVAVALEAGAGRVGLLRPPAGARPRRPGWRRAAMAASSIASRSARPSSGCRGPTTGAASPWAKQVSARSRNRGRAEPAHGLSPLPRTLGYHPLTVPVTL